MLKSTNDNIVFIQSIPMAPKRQASFFYLFTVLITW